MQRTCDKQATHPPWRQLCFPRTLVLGWAVTTATCLAVEREPWETLVVPTASQDQRAYASRTLTCSAQAHLERGRLHRGMARYDPFGGRLRLHCSRLIKILLCENGSLNESVGELTSQIRHYGSHELLVPTSCEIVPNPRSSVERVSRPCLCVYSRFSVL